MTPDSNRIQSVDALRGFALFGILQVNILAFSSVYFGSGQAAGVSSTVDAVLAFLISTVFELKFYLLFSLLFGYSVTLQSQSAEKAGAAFLPRMLRRQAGLFCIGALHAVLLFHGDILTSYAIIGILLLFARHWSDRRKFGVAAGLVAVTALFWLAVAGLQTLEAAPPAGSAAHFRQAIEAYRGAPSEIMGQHISDVVAFLPMLILIQAPCAFAMFLIGYVLGRRNILARSDLYRPHLDRAIRYGLWIGLPGAVFYAAATQFAPGSAIETAGLAVSIATAPFLTLAIVAMLLKLFEAPWARGGRDRLSSAGRMALSNYLLQSLACALVFHGYGLSLIDRLSLAATLLIGIAIFLLQLAASGWWLARFRYGPVEWLLRAITLARWPQWRLACSAPP